MPCEALLRITDRISWLWSWTWILFSISVSFIHFFAQQSLHSLKMCRTKNRRTDTSDPPYYSFAMYITGVVKRDKKWKRNSVMICLLLKTIIIRNRTDCCFLYIPCIYFAHDYRNRPFCSPAFFRKINGSLTRSIS